MIGFPPATTAEDWRVDVLSTDETTDDPFSLIGYSIEIELRHPNGEQSLFASTGNGRILPDATGFSIVVPAAQMSGLRPATYQLNGRIIAPTGEVVQIFREPFGLYEGGFN